MSSEDGLERPGRLCLEKTGRGHERCRQGFRGLSCGRRSHVFSVALEGKLGSKGDGGGVGEF